MWKNKYSECKCILFIGVLCIAYALEGSEYIGIAEVNQSKGSTRNGIVREQDIKEWDVRE